MTSDPPLQPPQDREPAEPPPPETFEPDAAEMLSELLDTGDLDMAVILARSLHPADLGAALSSIDSRVRELVLESLPPDEIGDALGYLEPHFRVDLLEGLPTAFVAEVLATVPDDIATDVVQELDPAEAREVVNAMPLEARQAIRDLLPYEEDTAGGRMTGQRVAVPPGLAVAEVIEFLRSQRPDAGTPFYVYVTGEDERLLGVLNMRAILMSPPDTLVPEIMQTELVTVQAVTDQEEVARLMKRYRLQAIPVIDDEGRLLGTVTSDDLIDVLEDEATEDIFRMAGVGPDEDLTSVTRSVRFRLPWLSVNLLTALLAAYVVSQFEGTLARAAVLAAFMPVVAGMGGNAGIQTSTVVVRSLALGRVTMRHTLPIVAHEVTTGLLMGVAVGGAVAAVSVLWRGNAWLGLIVGVALLGNVVLGVTAGALIPMGLHRLKQDPALSAAVWLTMFTDTLGFLLFLSLGTLVVNRIT